MRKMNKIIIHCTATQDGKDYTIKDITAWHKDRGFSEIGYHYVIYRDGSVHEGRNISKPGAHCLGQNTNSIGICYVGGVGKSLRPADTRTMAQKIALRDLVEHFRKEYPEATIHGHNEFANKDCPCFDVRKEFK